MKKALVLSILVIFAAVMVVSCSKGGGSPEKVADNFWSAMKTGQKDKIAPFVTKGSLGSIEDNAEKKDQEMGDITLGEAKIDGDKAEIPTKLKDKNMEIALTTYLVKEDGKWKVSVNETMLSMLGDAMGEMMKAMGDAMGDTVEGTAGKMAEGLNKAAEGIEKAAEKLQVNEPAKKEELKADAPPETKGFDTGDIVMIEWHGRWWPGKVIESGEDKWKISYDGYSSSWDEWVGSERIKNK